ncbi:indole-3-glycerol phosphate synthase TrpC [Bacteroidota bacterium]
MSDILNKIIEAKKLEVKEKKELFPEKLLERSIYYTTPAVSLKQYLLREDKCGIIAEFKKKSPSKGDINPYADIEDVSIGYMQAGASALSVLTDNQFFGGKNEDLTMARKFNYCPILRKDFIIDKYQIIEARSIGADVILLIAACLAYSELKELAGFAKSIGLETILEIHAKNEIKKINEHIDIIGVNNRNLINFNVSIDNSIEIFPELPAGILKISESGLNDPESIIKLQKTGYQGFLIGEYFMKHANPPLACEKFIKKIMSLTKD